jgi:hypothetical protein
MALIQRRACYRKTPRTDSVKACIAAGAGIAVIARSTVGNWRMHTQARLANIRRAWIVVIALGRRRAAFVLARCRTTVTIGCITIVALLGTGED